MVGSTRRKITSGLDKWQIVGEYPKIGGIFRIYIYAIHVWSIVNQKCLSFARSASVFRETLYTRILYIVVVMLCFDNKATWMDANLHESFAQKSRYKSQNFIVLS